MELFASIFLIFSSILKWCLILTMLSSDSYLSFWLSSTGCSYKKAVFTEKCAEKITKFYCSLWCFLKGIINKRRIRGRGWKATWRIGKTKTFRNSHPEVFLGKVFWKYAANLQDNTHAGVLFQQGCFATCTSACFATLLKSHFGMGIFL